MVISWGVPVLISASCQNIILTFLLKLCKGGQRHHVYIYKLPAFINYLTVSWEAKPLWFITHNLFLCKIHILPIHIPEALKILQNQNTGNNKIKSKTIRNNNVTDLPSCCLITKDFQEKTGLTILWKIVRVGPFVSGRITCSKGGWGRMGHNHWESLLPCCLPL